MRVAHITIDFPADYAEVFIGKNITVEVCMNGCAKNHRQYMQAKAEMIAQESM